MHHWQDLVLAISVLAFNIALIPTVIGESKPALSTSVITTIFVIATVVVYISLSLWYTTVMGSINAVIWGTLAFQKLRQSKT
jgi:hypothetical protein